MELLARIAVRSSLSRADAGTAVDAVVSAIADALERREAVNIAGFGKFSASNRAARRDRNPRTGEAVVISRPHRADFQGWQGPEIG